MDKAELDQALAEIEQKMGRQFVEDLRAVAVSLRTTEPGSEERRAAVHRAAALYFALDSGDVDRLVVILPELRGGHDG